MPPGTPYTPSFYDRHREGAARSAKEIVPLVLELIQPRSVVDVGCGVGTWLSVWREHGVEDILGIDGDWVDKTVLVIPEERFLAIDLQKPFRLDRQFDLVVALEVAEHLPGESAEAFVDSLTTLGPVILFSAAIPDQGGTRHLNEQWPEYWVNHFQERGYVAIDCVRKKIWRNENVEWFYAQNILIFARRDHVDSRPVLKEEFERTASDQLSLVHPRKYVEAIRELRRLLLTAQEIAGLVPPRHTFVLVDHEVLRTELADASRVIPFLEREGQYWGPPADDMTAIEELERLRGSGATFVIFAWPAFWWLDYYSEFHRYLRSRFPCLLANERLVVFDLRGHRRAPGE